jgi:CYTH domain-containing protein/CHAD domain-containing protein
LSAEIERKFVLSELPPGLNEHPSTEIEQGYLAIDDEAEVRVRRAGDESRLTVKRGQGETREEIEIELARDQFDALWPLTESRRVRKRRYRMRLDGGACAEVDQYGGGLSGLLVAEVEFPSERDAAGFRAPPWFGEDVTADDRYANRTLALEGAPKDGAGPSRAYRLEAGESPTAGMRRVALGRAERATERLQEAARAEDPSACIHAARKDLKKLRAVIRLLRRELGDELYRAENDRCREAGKLLSPSRDAEVKVETLESLRERCSGRLAPADTSAWLDALRQERDDAVGQAREGDADALRTALAIVEERRARIRAWPLRTGSWKLVGPGIGRAYRRGKREMRGAAEDPSGTNMHEWRKRAKDLWYHLRILRDARPEALHDSLGLADELAGVLGDHHDLTLLRDDLLRRDLPLAGRAALVAAIAGRQDELAGTAFELGERLYAKKPKAFRRKLGRGWKKWREG